MNHLGDELEEKGTLYLGKCAVESRRKVIKRGRPVTSGVEKLLLGKTEAVLK